MPNPNNLALYMVAYYIIKVKLFSPNKKAHITQGFFLNKIPLISHKKTVIMVTETVANKEQRIHAHFG